MVPSGTHGNPFVPNLPVPGLPFANGWFSGHFFSSLLLLYLLTHYSLYLFEFALGEWITHFVVVPHLKLLPPCCSPRPDPEGASIIVLQEKKCSESRPPGKRRSKTPCPSKLARKYFGFRQRDPKKICGHKLEGKECLGIK